MSDLRSKERRYNIWIIAFSIIIPVIVAFLFSLRLPGVERMGYLPPIYAAINGLTAVFLIIAVMQIKRGNRVWHENLMRAAMVCSVIFLILYLLYHATADATKFGDTNMDGVLSASEKADVGPFIYVYYFILFTHILLSIIVIPFVLVTYVRALNGKFKLHKKLARITYPIWLYVAVTGVVVYILISPYYPLET